MIYACEHHDAVLEQWRRDDRHGIRLAHVDFHDDLRGLLIDRPGRRAFAIGALARGRAALDPGNFLAHAVVERRVDALRWIHDEIGGRAWDAGIVRYESDLFAWPHRLSCVIRGTPPVVLAFEELLLREWRGPRADEALSIDWDCLASLLMDAGGIERRAADLLERLGRSAPPATYVAYSPEYCHPSVPTFLDFVRELGSRFAQPVEWLSPDLEHGRLHPTDVDPFPPTHWRMRLTLRLRRLGLY